MRKRDFAISLAAALVIPANAQAQFNRVHIDPTTGRVGYHMSIAFLYYRDDLPPGNTGSVAAGSCRAGQGRYSYSGELPPGIKLSETYGDPVFSGTPRQPGIWQGTLSYSVKCRGGPDQNVYERTLPVTWSIEP
jgi:hypothetical protein